MYKTDTASSFVHHEAKRKSFHIEDILNGPLSSNNKRFRSETEFISFQCCKGDYLLQKASMIMGNFIIRCGEKPDNMFLNFPTTPSRHKKERRTRTVFTDRQLAALEDHFVIQKYLSSSDRNNLAEKLSLNQLQVKTWYQNRRMKWKKEVMKDGCSEPPTKPKGRPCKDSIPSLASRLTYIGQ